jgi:hypothetical protein
MTDETKTLAEIGFVAKYDESNYGDGSVYSPENPEVAGPKEGRLIDVRPIAESVAKTGQQRRAPASAAEIDQRRANKNRHSERAVPMGRKFRY